MSLSATSVSHPFVQPGFKSDDQDEQKILRRVEMTDVERELLQQRCTSRSQTDKGERLWLPTKHLERINQEVL